MAVDIRHCRLAGLLTIAAPALLACQGSGDVAHPGGADASMAADARSGHPDSSVADTSLPDSGGPDTGSTDSAALEAGPADAAADAAETGSCVGALVCDDFESYPVSGPPKGPWKVTANGGTVVVDSVHAHSGTHAVHVSTAGGATAYEQAFIYVTGSPIFPVAGNTIFGRMAMWLTAAPTQTTHWSNVWGSGQVTGMSFSAVSRYGGQDSPLMMASYDTSGVASDCWQHSQTAIPVQRWACFEWRFDGPTDEMDFWLDGAAVSDLTVMGQGQGCINNGTNGKWFLPAYDTMSMGWEHYQASDAIDMWIDDVALDVQRIGCAP